MPLTSAQSETLKTFVQNDATLGPKTSGSGTDFGFIVDALNAPAAPDYWVWRSRVTKKEITDEPSQTGTNFTWAGNGFVSRALGEIEAWKALFNSVLECNPSRVNVRQAFTDIFSGAGNAASNRAHLLSVCRRKATLAERQFVLGLANGSVPNGSGVGPDNLGWEGPITLGDIIQMFQS